ncbi:hypothetical protein C8R45DRAFT_1188907 [Mycena sanguinolenta]|nr:hypothetical protein C8R45DRAFT_1188907 [Mycena sanguinolenta]
MNHGVKAGFPSPSPPFAHVRLHEPPPPAQQQERPPSPARAPPSPSPCLYPPFLRVPIISAIERPSTITVAVLANLVLLEIVRSLIEASVRRSSCGGPEVERRVGSGGSVLPSLNRNFNLTFDPEDPPPLCLLHRRLQRVQQRTTDAPPQQLANASTTTAHYPAPAACAAETRGPPALPALRRLSSLPAFPSALRWFSGEICCAQWCCFNR